MTEIQAIIEIASENRLPLDDEKRMQSALGVALHEGGISAQPEHELSPGNVVDFMTSTGVAVECKLRARKRDIYRQLQRYARHSEVVALVLVTNTAMGLPRSIESKPVYYCSLGAAWL